MAMGAARSRRRSRGAVQARGVSERGAALCEIRGIMSQFGATENGPTAMTRQSLSRLAQLPRASLTAFCSLAALSDNPGRPAAPTATAFHPDEASASLRATSSLASAAIEELL